MEAFIKLEVKEALRLQAEYIRVNVYKHSILLDLFRIGAVNKKDLYIKDGYIMNGFHKVEKLNLG